MTLLYILISLLLIMVCAATYFGYKAASLKDDIANGPVASIESIGKDLAKIENAVKQEISLNRMELGQVSKDGRTEMINSLMAFNEVIVQSIKDASQFQKNQLEIFSNNLNTLINGTDVNAKENRKELREALVTFKNDFTASVNDFNKMQQDNFFALLQKQDQQNQLTSSKLDLMRDTIEKKITFLQEGNEKKLEEMRQTVNEKLEQTLETRLANSFQLVSERLEAVHRGLGDMQQLATGVGDLKKVLSNVKTRGIMGEYQLENILEQLLTPDQYGKNVRTKAGSNASVEFAVKLPGRTDKDTSLWLPVDSKFPKEDFELLLEAYEKCNAEQIEECRKNFIRNFKRCASEIRDKYIDPPNTTDFAILFLPFESLYAEVLRTPGLFEQIQRECRIIITGPTTLSALLNSLQMGFRTLAIEKRSSEVWELLSVVKKEFSLFGTILEKTQKKLVEATHVIQDAGRRSRVIERRLKKVQELPKEQAKLMFGEVRIIEENQIMEESETSAD